MTTQLEAVGIRLEPKIKAKLKEEADRQRRTVSNLVALLCAQFCQSLEKPKKADTINGHAHKAVTPPA